MGRGGNCGLTRLRGTDGLSNLDDMQRLIAVCVEGLIRETGLLTDLISGRPASGALASRSTEVSWTSFINLAGAVLLNDIESCPKVICAERFGGKLLLLLIISPTFLLVAIFPKLSLEVLFDGD